MIMFDTRNQKDGFIYNKLIEQGYAVHRTKLPFGDIALATNILNAIDIKSCGGGLLELANNICSKDHGRLKREIELCGEYGGTLTFLVVNPSVACLDDVETWQPPVYRGGAKKGQPISRVKGETLSKALRTMSAKGHYKCEVRFVFATKETAYQKVLEILEVKDE